METMTMAVLYGFVAVALAGAVFFARELHHYLRQMARARGGYVSSGAPVSDASRLAVGACLALLLFLALYVVAHLAIALIGAALDGIGSHAAFLAMTMPVWPALDTARLQSLPDADGRLPLASFAFPGGYPVIYLDSDGATLCPGCANEEDSARYLSPDDDGCLLDAPIVSYFLNYEEEVYCDGCGAIQMGAYLEAESAGREAAS